MLLFVDKGDLRKKKKRQKCNTTALQSNDSWDPTYCRQKLNKAQYCLIYFMYNNLLFKQSQHCINDTLRGSFFVKWNHSNRLCNPENEDRKLLTEYHHWNWQIPNCEPPLHLVRWSYCQRRSKESETSNSPFTLNPSCGSWLRNWVWPAVGWVNKLTCGSRWYSKPSRQCPQ